MPGEIAAKRLRADGVAVMHDKKRSAKIHQGECDGVARTSGADQHDGCALCAANSKAFFETMAPPTPVKIVTGGAAVGGNRNGIDRADLSSLGDHAVEQRQNVLLVGISDIRAGKARSFDCFKKLWERPASQAIDVHQMVEPIDPRGLESIRE